MSIISKIARKTLIPLAVFLCTFNNSIAQKNIHSFSVEAFRAQNTIGVNYDARINGNYGLGYRVGIGFGYADNSGLFDQNIKGVGVPLELNYLLGKKNHKLEFGFGTSLGIYHVKETTWYYYQPVPPETEEHDEQYISTSNCFGYFIFGNIGYRYQREHGFTFRIGITPSFNFGDKYGLKRAVFYPYIGFGKSF